jgi:hypothetical protein
MRDLLLVIAVLTERYLADREHWQSKLAKQALKCNCVLRCGALAERSGREAFADGREAWHGCWRAAERGALAELARESGCAWLSVG